MKDNNEKEMEEKKNQYQPSSNKPQDKLDKNKKNIQEHPEDQNSG